MPRKIGWQDETIQAGYGRRDKDRQFRGKEGQKQIIRVMSGSPLEYRVHAVDDVLDPDKNGEPRVFNMICSREWDDSAEDYVGECLGCDRDYDVSAKYITGILLLAEERAKGKYQKIDPDVSPMFWDFGADKYRKLSDKALELARGDDDKKLPQVELVISCEDEEWQKLEISFSQGKQITTKEHVKAWKEEGDSLVEKHCKPPTIAEQKRNLKKKKPKRGARKTDDDGEFVVGEDEDEEAPAPKKRRKATSKKKPAASKKKPVDDEPEEEGSTGDEDLDELLSEL